MAELISSGPHADQFALPDHKEGQLDTGHGGGMGKTSSITQINQEGVTWGWQSICILDTASRVHH